MQQLEDTMNEMQKHLEEQGFAKDQMEEMRKGAEAGLDVKIYAKKEFLAIQMQQIRLGLMKKLPVEVYAKTEYDWFQMEEIRKGLEAGLDISIYASPDVSYDRMQQIRLGLAEGINLASYKRLDAGVLKQMRLALMNHVNIVPYIVSGYDAEQLEAIREALEKEIDITPWVQKEYRGIALREIFQGLENGVDVAVYAKIEYNWQQMREIRKGLEHMVDTDRYKSVFYSYKQMREIRRGLEDGLDVSYFQSPMYTALEMKKRRIFMKKYPAAVLTENIEKPVPVQGTGKVGSASKRYEITISENEMEAYIMVHGSAEEFDRIDIVKILQEKGICYGIRYDVIEEVVSGNSQRKPLLIAGGQIRVDGKDGWYEFFFRTQVARTPKQLEGGNVDYRNVEWFETVEKGQKLALYHNSEPGVNGITVTGKVLPAKSGKEKNILIGKGFKRLPDGKTYISEMQGIVTIQDNRLNVSELLVMDEVNMTTGNVEYSGNVLIEGNVSSGSKIRAGKDVIVKGYVEASQIISGGTVFLQKGMNGSGNGTVVAAGDVIGYFFERSEVYAGGDIQGNYFFNSVLSARGKVKASGKKGTIAGGSTFAEDGLHANSVGNTAGLSTYVRIGRLDRIKQEEDKLNETIRAVNQELFALQNAHREFQTKYPAEIRNTMEIYLKIESAIYTKEKQMEELLRQKSALVEEIKKSGNVTATVEGQIYEGVMFEIDGAHWNAKNVKNVTLRKTENRIAIFSKSRG